MSKDNDKGTGPNQANPYGAPKGAYGPDQKTKELLEYQNKNQADPSDPIKRLGLGKKLREINPDGGENK